MKTLKLLIFIGFLTFSCSCTIEKRLHLSGYNIDWKNKKNLSENKKSLEKNSFAKIEIPKKEIVNSITTSEETKAAESNFDNSFSASNNLVDHIINQKKVLENCDIIITKDGDEIEATIIDVGINEIRYKKCGFPDGPDYSIKKEDVFMIKYINGTKDIFKTENFIESQVSSSKPIERFFKINGIGLAALIISIVGLFKFQIILGLISIILGIVGLINFSDEHRNEKIEAFGILAIIIGFIDIIFGLLLLFLSAIFL